MAKGSVKVRFYDSGTVAQIIRPQVVAHFLPRARRIEQAARQGAPVGTTGNLARSIRLRARDQGGRFATLSPNATGIVSYEIGVGVDYGGYVSRGTAAHPIAAHGDYSLHNPQTGQYFGRLVMHPGTLPNDYLQRSLKAGGF